MENRRPKALDEYFSVVHGFFAERTFGDVIIYKRFTEEGIIERIVVKHATAPVWEQANAIDDEFEEEENLMARLWGSEHTIRLLSIVDDEDHTESRLWRLPLNRDDQTRAPVLPWKLSIDQELYPHLNFQFFVMEHLDRGTGPEEAQTDNIFYVAEVIQQLANLREEKFQLVSERPRFWIRNAPGAADFETYASPEFQGNEMFGYHLRLLVCLCMAVEEGYRPNLRLVLQYCEHYVGLTTNWHDFADEIYEIFEALPIGKK
ncbi:hypothetical protein F4808DRAFT_463776 [Astrocystis sublimbata]|nr:hypothetical protein F4808DRAFT_463776 [Astrocystis sublimbata]